MKYKTLKITIFLAFCLGLVSCKNKYDIEIEKTCIECSSQVIRNTDFILVTNKEGISNVFDKKDMKFRLSNWYPAKFNKGIIFDDITFTVNGINVMCDVTPSENEISDEHINQKTIGDNSKSTPSTIAFCVVCGKETDYHQENLMTGHHYTVDGIKSSDVVCSLDCHVKLQQKIEHIINREN